MEVVAALTLNAIVTLNEAGARAASDASTTRWADGAALDRCSSENASSSGANPPPNHHGAAALRPQQPS